MKKAENEIALRERETRVAGILAAQDGLAEPEAGTGLFGGPPALVTKWGPLVVVAGVVAVVILLIAFGVVRM